MDATAPVIDDGTGHRRRHRPSTTAPAIVVAIRLQKTETSCYPSSMAFEIALGAGSAQPSHQPIDKLGTLASSACAAHCVLSSMLPEALAAVGLGALLGHESEWGFTFAALAFAAAALSLGWRKHRAWPVVALLAGGSVALLLARSLEGAGEMVCISLSIFGGALLVAGHLVNIRASRRMRAATA